MIVSSVPVSFTYLDVWKGLEQAWLTQDARDPSDLRLDPVSVLCQPILLSLRLEGLGVHAVQLSDERLLVVDGQVELRLGSRHRILRDVQQMVHQLLSPRHPVRHQEVKAQAGPTLTHLVRCQMAKASKLVEIHLSPYLMSAFLSSLLMRSSIFTKRSSASIT